MTGYGRAEAIAEDYLVTVELKSVNHRFKEVFVHAPREWMKVDERIKSLVQTKVQRGKVDVYVNVNARGDAGSAYQVDEPLLDAVLHLGQHLIENKQVSGSVMDHILSVPGLFVLKSTPILDDRLEGLVLEAANGALQEMTDRRRTEGLKLQTHLRARLLDMQQFVEQVKPLYPRSIEAFRTRLKQRVESILHNEIPDERLAIETAIAAEKTSIEEEWERLSSHLLQFEHLLFKDNEAVGRQMDFLLQEMVREVNTIGSKANDLEISGLVLDAKHALEQMREQSQNVE